MSYVVIDTETSKIPYSFPWQPQAYFVALGLRTDKGKEQTYLFNHAHHPVDDFATSIASIKEELYKHDVWVFHNSKFDLHWLNHLGIDVNRSAVNYCTMIGEYILYGQNTNTELSLNACCIRRELPVKHTTLSEWYECGHDTDEIPWDLLKEYMINDIRITEQLFLAQKVNLKKAKLQAIANVSFAITPVLVHMESNGLFFDKDAAYLVHDHYINQLEELDWNLQALAGWEFNPGSSSQLMTAMFGGAYKRVVKELVTKFRKDGSHRIITRNCDAIFHTPGLGFIPHDKTFNAKTGRYSTGKKARALLRWETPLQESFLRCLQARANAAKVCSTLLSNKDDEKGFINIVGIDNKIHPTFNQCVSWTGRLTSSNPNGQNLPRSGTSPLKKLFKSELGCIVNADLSQVEWRIAAALSGDQIMIDEVNNNVDCHTANARAFFGVADEPDTSLKFKQARQACKVFNFRMIYGGTAHAFFYDGDMPRFSLKKWEGIVDAFWNKYHGLRDWQNKNKKLLDKNHYLRNDSGRILTFHYNNDPDAGALGYSFQRVCNYPVQSGGTADLPQLAMVEIYKRLLPQIKEGSVKMLLQVHDSVVLDSTKENAYLVAKTCLEVFEALPELAKTTYNWTIPVKLEGTAQFGKTYGSLGKEFKGIGNLTEAAVTDELNNIQ